MKSNPNANLQSEATIHPEQGPSAAAAPPPRTGVRILSNTGGVFATTAYLVADELTRQAVIFDAPNDTVAPLIETAKKNGWEIIGLWLTHGHIDHIADHAVITQTFPKAKVLIHQADERKLQNPMSMYAVPFVTPPGNADGYLTGGQILHIGSTEVQVMETPGHSPGHVAFYIPSEKVLVGGDLILMGAVGRTDFPDCSFPDLQASLRRVMKLPGDTQLLPGHGRPSLLGDEAATNPYVRQAIGI
jgi:glyoxylase-like metal-dependent hydrolase (beta-lactamase superfamily II)